MEEMFAGHLSDRLLFLKLQQADQTLQSFILGVGLGGTGTIRPGHKVTHNYVDTSLKDCSALNSEINGVCRIMCTYRCDRAMH